MRQCSLAPSFFSSSYCAGVRLAVTRTHFPPFSGGDAEEADQQGADVAGGVVTAALLRNEPLKIRNRQLGVRSGVPDLMLPIPSQGYHGMFIEMKTKTGRVSENQKRWLSALNGFGYLAVVAYGWEDARCKILDYLQTS